MRPPLKRYRCFRRGRSRYGAKPVHDLATGQTFDSKSEALRYGMLKVMERAGEISNLTLHPKVVLMPARDRAPEIAYRPDYSYTESGRTVYEDSKARQRPGRPLRLEARESLLLKLWAHHGPGLLRITGKCGEVLRTVMGNAS